MLDGNMKIMMLYPSYVYGVDYGNEILDGLVPATLRLMMTLNALHIPN